MIEGQEVSYLYELSKLVLKIKLAQVRFIVQRNFIYNATVISDCFKSRALF